jgi:hypothetical protein
MAAVKLKLPVIEQGATYFTSFRYLQADKITPMELTGVTAKMQIRATIADELPLIELSTENQRIVLDIVTGIISIKIHSLDTTTLPAVIDAVYDLELYYPDESVIRLLEGKVSVSPEVTRG